MDRHWFCTFSSIGQEEELFQNDFFDYSSNCNDDNNNNNIRSSISSKLSILVLSSLVHANDSKSFLYHNNAFSWKYGRSNHNDLARNHHGNIHRLSRANGSFRASFT